MEDLIYRNEKLREENNILKALLENTHTHLAYLDRDFNFVYINEAYASGSGHSKAELVGKNHFAFFPNPENEKLFRECRDTAKPVRFHDKPFQYVDQPERGVTYWDWSLIPVKDSTGTVTGLVFSLTETTKRKKAEDRMRDAIEELESFSYSILTTFAPRFRPYSVYAGFFSKIIRIYLTNPEERSFCALKNPARR